jgi:hypothetical protein
MMQRKKPHAMARPVASGGACDAGTIGSYSTPAGSGTYAFSGRDRDSLVSMLTLS